MKNLFQPDNYGQTNIFEDLFKPIPYLMFNCELDLSKQSMGILIHMNLCYQNY